MLHEGRLPLSPAENDAVDALIAQHPDTPISLTRRDPGESGPVWAHVGDDTYEINENGQAAKL